MLELNQLYNMDCMEGMKTFPYKYFDLAIVDPPYGIGNFIPQTGKQKGQKFDVVGWNDKIPSIEYFQELHRISKHRIIWGANYYNCFEELGGSIIWNKQQYNPKMSRCEIASHSFYKKNDYYEYSWNGRNPLQKKAFHPCQKPIALYKWILHKYAKPDFKIIDTHAGSCSSVIAFLDFGCDWIAFETDKDYYEAASKRIENHKMQLKLF